MSNRGAQRRVSLYLKGALWVPKCPDAKWDCEGTRRGWHIEKLIFFYLDSSVGLTG